MINLTLANSSILSLMIVMTLGLISPGPDFVIVLKNSLSYSRKYGIYTALGVALGTLVHVVYISLGLGFLIKQNIWILLVLKYLGASYLVYIGYKSFASAGDRVISHDAVSVRMSAMQSIFSGFLTNALNPKAMLFFIGVFTLVVDSNTDASQVVLYGLMIFIQTFLWFTVVALMFSNKALKSKFEKARCYIDKAIGIIFIGIGAKLMLSKVE